MIEDLKVIIDNHGLFLILFFSGVLFGVVAQKMIDNQPVKPYIKRIAVAGMTMAIALSLNKVVGHFKAGFLYPWSPVLGFFGEALLETVNQKRYGISTGFLELLLEKLGFVKKRDGKNEDISQKWEVCNRNVCVDIFKFSNHIGIKRLSKKTEFKLVAE